ncbi:MAG: FxsA family protein [Burkholderiales bacterium]|nr:FxsA family protein [Burkholderiales bacterium]
MRILSIFLCVLGFPVLEAWLLLRLGDRFGAWVLVWLLVAAIAGALLIRFEKLVWAIRLAGTLRQSRSPLTALLTSARTLVAGLLLIFPGVITDVLALLLLVWPLPQARPFPPAASGPEVIEGEFRREQGERLPGRR